MRLGCRKERFEEIKAHPWFAEIDWVALEAKKCKPLFVPDADKANFDATYDLEELLLEDCQNVTDEVVHALVQRGHARTLRTLSLSGCTNVTPRSGFDLLLNSCGPRLVEVYLDTTSLDRGGVEVLVRTCPNVRSLRMGQCARIDDEAVVCAVVGLRRLEDLVVGYSEGITDGWVVELARRADNAILVAEAERRKSREGMCGGVGYDGTGMRIDEDQNDAVEHAVQGKGKGKAPMTELVEYQDLRSRTPFEYAAGTMHDTGGSNMNYDTKGKGKDQTKSAASSFLSSPFSSKLRTINQSA
ncbi:hypothetical protein HK102_011791, partial [Quaeritorhiza haematococci]